MLVQRVQDLENHLENVAIENFLEIHLVDVSHVNTAVTLSILKQLVRFEYVTFISDDLCFINKFQAHASLKNASPFVSIIHNLVHVNTIHFMIVFLTFPTF